MAFKIKVENYGKIKDAEIDVLPLTLFVGDNNSGKSYLLSLIWSILSGKQNYIIFKGLPELIKTEGKVLYNDLYNYIIEKEACKDCTAYVLEGKQLLKLINALFKKNKDELVKNLFNYENMSIGHISFCNEDEFYFELKKEAHTKDHLLIKVSNSNKNEVMGFMFPSHIENDELIVIHILERLMEYIICKRNLHGKTFYLPAARTGFMLAKNAINQTARKNAFDIFDINSSPENTNITPFPKPIIHFLDSIDNIDVQQKTTYNDEIIDWITKNMSHGDVEYIEGNTGNVQYIPNGSNQGLPLRVTSGVVTELTPLILLLKHFKCINTLCYEEPEMCLHPQLQFQMARLLIRLVNNKMNVIATTHSDIIIQHINNMCQLMDGYKKQGLNFDLNIDSDFDFDEKDLIDIKKVAIYQLQDCGERTEVKRLIPINNSFEVESFTTALNKILNQTIGISNILNI